MLLSGLGCNFVSWLVSGPATISIPGLVFVICGIRYRHSEQQRRKMPPGNKSNKKASLKKKVPVDVDADAVVEG